MPHELTANQKKSQFWSVVFSYSMQQQQTISSSDCDVRQKVYFMQLVTTSLVVGPRRSSKALPKAKLAPKKGHSHWRSAANLIHYSLLNPGKNITSEKYVQQKRWTKNCSACSRHWSTERAQFSTTVRHHMSHNECFKSWTNWPTKFYLILHIHLTSCQPTTTSSSISTKFLHRKCFDSQQEAENAFKSYLNPEARIFMLQE